MVLHTLPWLTLTGIWFAKIIMIGIVFLGRLIQWLFLVQASTPKTVLLEFLYTPLLLFNSKKPERFLSIENKHLQIIKSWVGIEREIIQMKLIPATLGVAVLGIIASTIIGESLVQVVKETIIEMISLTPTDSQAGVLVAIISETKIIPLAKLIIIGIVFGILVLPTTVLLNRSTVLAFIAEACVLTESVKLIQNNERKKTSSRKLKKKK